MPSTLFFGKVSYLGYFHLIIPLQWIAGIFRGAFGAPPGPNFAGPFVAPLFGSKKNRLGQRGYRPQVRAFIRAL